MTHIKTIKNFKLKGKRVFLRLDFNVPLSAPNAEGIRTVEDDTRIREALPTIQYAREQGAKVIIASHLGRPKGKKNEDYSLMPAAEKLAELLEDDVMLTDDCVGEGIELKVNALQEGEVLILENLRFHPEEEANDLEFAQKLARLCDIYINDAFGAAHRKHASTHRLPSLMQDRGVGFLIEKEVTYFDRLLHQPKKPFYLILGGAKVSDKIQTIQALLKNVQGVVVGGAMAYAFLKAQGKTIPSEWKQPAPEDTEAAKKILAEAKIKHIPILLPEDTQSGFDIGPKSITRFKDFLKDAKTIFWNGPLGWFEKPEYATGTHEISKMIAEKIAETEAASQTDSCMVVVGGGDTVSAIQHTGNLSDGSSIASHFTHLSTGGGAALEYLEKGNLPGIEVLKIIGYKAESIDLGDVPYQEDSPKEKKS